MIYPLSLYNFGKVCPDSQTAGNILRALCKQPVELNASEQTILAMIQNDNAWMDERVAAKREKAAERKRKSRENGGDYSAETDTTALGHTPSHDVTLGHTLSRDVTPCHADECDGQMSRALPSFLPSSLPTILPSSNQEYINRSVHDTDTDAAKAAKSVAGSDRVKKIDVYRLGDDEFFSGIHSTYDLYINACGKGFWLKAIRTLGDAECLEELNKFVHEVRAGEAPTNPAAVMTARLKKLGVK